MYEFLAWLEGSALGAGIRGMGVWTYGVLNLAHIVGIATLFGSVLILDLRLLGLWRESSLRSILTPTLPLAVTGFSIATVSGVCMITTNATDYAGNPFLLIKFPAIGLGLINALTVSSLPAWKAARASSGHAERESWQLAAAGGASLLCWLVALASGRMIGYW